MNFTRAALLLHDIRLIPEDDDHREELRRELVAGPIVLEPGEDLSWVIILTTPRPPVDGIQSDRAEPALDRSPARVVQWRRWSPARPRQWHRGAAGG